VRVVAEGPEAALQQLVAWLHVGSPYGRVDKVDVAWSAAPAEYKDFQVRWHG
jgi:acylphosphatase